VDALLEFIQKERTRESEIKAAEHEFLAAIHGHKIKKNRPVGENESEKQRPAEGKGTPIRLNSGEIVYYDGNPESVAHLPMEVREEMTEKLMADFRGMSVSGVKFG
jgi:hypothetical protein